MNKVELRNNILNKRDLLKGSERVNKDIKITEKLLSTSLYKKSNNIFIYVSYGSEVDTKRIIDTALNDNKKVFVPKIKEEFKIMEAVRINSLEELQKGKYGILEPKTFNEVIDKKELDIIIVPGVVFDMQGNRIGYGGGYYDKYLRDIANNKNKVALAYDFQVMEELKSEEHDIKVDYILTDKSKKI